MITDKGREEILKLISSDLVGTWAETDRTLKNVVRMLLVQRPDLIRLYFYPAVWARIVALERREAAAVILALLKAAVISAAGNPQVCAWDQAVFYMGTRIPQYMDMAERWAAENPQDCEYPLARRRPRPIALPSAD